jgi:hypothetical protein
MAFFLRVWDPNNNPVLAPDGVTLSPNSWSAAAVGGPVAAQINATGSIDGLLALGSWLGYRIQIVTADGLPVWWGSVDGVSLSTGGLDREITLNEMANRVKVLYSQASPGGGLVGAETDWSEDAASVAAYGKRELVHSASSSLTAAQAAALRARILTAGKSPQRRLHVSDARQNQARITCRGHWARLADVYYQQLDGREEHNPGSGKAIPLGLGFTSAYLAFINADSKYLMQDTAGNLLRFGDYADLKIVVANTTYNNGVRTVQSGDKRAAVSYTSNAVSFAANDDLYDGNLGLAFIATDDAIFVSGASMPENTGARRVKTTGVSHIEVSIGWNSGFRDSGGVGPPVTIARGNSVTLAEAVAHEAPNGTTGETITAYGQRIYQTLSLAINSQWTLNAVELRVRRVGSPADSLRVGIYLDNGGAPGALIEQVTIAGAALPDTMGWVNVPFANTTVLSYGATYGLALDRTGAMAPGAFYEVEVDDDSGYTRGSLRLFDGAAYQPTAADLIFRCLGAQDTARQVGDVVVGAGVGLGPALITDSGLTTLQFQSGDETALAIVEGLLAQGASSGERLLAAVTADRLVHIFVRTAASAAPRLLTWRNGRLEQAQGEPVVAGWLPAGARIYVDDVLLTGAWAGLSPVFVERAEYVVGQGLRLETEDQRALAALFGTQQG